jgi:hypothetical protein
MIANSGMSRLGISGIALPAIACRSPTIPTVDSITDKIWVSRFFPADDESPIR